MPQPAFKITIPESLSERVILALSDPGTPAERLAEARKKCGQAIAKEVLFAEDQKANAERSPLQGIE